MIVMGMERKMKGKGVQCEEKTKSELGWRYMRGMTRVGQKLRVNRSDEQGTIGSKLDSRDRNLNLSLFYLACQSMPPAFSWD
jgi:hypothetical protein